MPPGPKYTTLLGIKQARFEEIGPQCLGYFSFGYKQAHLFTKKQFANRVIRYSPLMVADPVCYLHKLFAKEKAAGVYSTHGTPAHGCGYKHHLRLWSSAADMAMEYGHLSNCGFIRPRCAPLPEVPQSGRRCRPPQCPAASHRCPPNGEHSSRRRTRPRLLP